MTSLEYFKIQHTNFGIAESEILDMEPVTGYLYLIDLDKSKFKEGLEEYLKSYGADLDYTAELIINHYMTLPEEKLKTLIGYTTLEELEAWGIPFSSEG